MFHTAFFILIAVTPDANALAVECHERAERIAAQLGDDCSVIERPPFVIAGDMSQEKLAQRYNDTIAPAVQAMDRAYLNTMPSHCITVLLFRNERSYDHYADELFGDKDVSIYGYYKPTVRTLVMNLGTGTGTLTHELTHALVDFDFPQIPDWFNEGLASLHEQCRFREDGSGIDGLTNWRLPGLQEAIREKRLRSIGELVADRNFRTRQVGLNYAHARYLCMYLQEQKKLELFYARFRAKYDEDPTGAATLKQTFGDKPWAEVDDAFEKWVLTLE
jgi:hypothetical protein